MHIRRTYTHVLIWVLLSQHVTYPRSLSILITENNNIYFLTNGSSENHHLFKNKTPRYVFRRARLRCREAWALPTTIGATSVGLARQKDVVDSFGRSESPKKSEK